MSNLLLDEDCCQTQEELAESLEVTQAAISKRLKCFWNATKRSHFCIGLLLVMKNESITTTPSVKNHM